MKMEGHGYFLESAGVHSEDKIPEDKTGGGYYPQAYSRIMIFFFLQSRTG